MSQAERLRQLPGYLAFNVGVMFLIGAALQLTSGKADAALGADQLRLLGFGVLSAVLAVALGFASVARVEFARREGRKFSAAWIIPSVLMGLPVGHAVAAGDLTGNALKVAAIGLTAALAGLAWQAVRARQEIKA